MNTNPADVLAYSEAATEGPWQVDADEDSVAVNALSARTTWTEMASGDQMGREPGSWRATHRILENEAQDGTGWDDMDEAEDEDRRVREADATFIANARTDLPALAAFAQDVLALHRRVFDAANLPACRECADDYPCPTVQLATKHGIEVTA